MSALAAIDTSAARLPAAYEAAVTALANCASIDECKDWADKAEALASYAKQADDDTLRKQADRIQARAIRRCGELLRQFESKGGRPSETSKADLTSFPASQRDAAKRAGISVHQQRTAVRVANVPRDDFERQVESESPPTVTALAKQGTKRQAVDLKGRNPDDFNKALHFKGMFQDYSRELAKWSLPDILPRLIDSEREAIRQLITQLDAVHDAIMTRI